jgi:hypothetical protein
MIGVKKYQRYLSFDKLSELLPTVYRRLFRNSGIINEIDEKRYTFYVRFKTTWSSQKIEEKVYKNFNLGCIRLRAESHVEDKCFELHYKGLSHAENNLRSKNYSVLF